MSENSQKLRSAQFEILKPAAKPVESLRKLKEPQMAIRKPASQKVILDTEESKKIITKPKKSLNDRLGKKIEERLGKTIEERLGNPYPKGTIIIGSHVLLPKPKSSESNRSRN